MIPQPLDVATPSSSTLVVLLPGADTQIVGGSARARNLRVATRAGATVVDLKEFLAGSATPWKSLIVIPPSVLIDLTLFSVAIPSATTRLESASGAWILMGRASDVAGHLEGWQAELDSHGRQGERADVWRADELPRLPAPTDVIFDTSTAAARRHALWSILKRTEKPTDGWVSRHCNRPISRLISFVLLSLGLRASHASALTLIFGLATAIFALRPGYATLVWTGLLFQLASVLDGVDGEMARATLTESEAGAKLDAIVDQLTYVACFVGVTIGWAREGGAGQALFWTAVIAAALVLSLLRGARFVARHAPDASFVFIDRSVRRAARESNQLPLRLAAGGFALLRRDLFSVLFLAVSFFGRRALIPALVGVGVVLANVTMSVYRRELDAAAVLERG